MRLVFDSRGAAAGLKRYKGEGIYSSIGRKVLLSGLRKVINTLEKENPSQKIADVVVNGRREDSRSIKKKVVSTPQAGVKRKSSLASSKPQPAKARKYSNSTTERFINRVGPGILLD